MDPKPRSLSDYLFYSNKKFLDDGPQSLFLIQIHQVNFGNFNKFKNPALQPCFLALPRALVLHLFSSPDLVLL